MRILSLIENTSATDKLTAEHGLSLYVEFGAKKYLIDTGASEAFIDNALRMRIDLSKIDAVIISHNHDDHTGGLAAFLEKYPDVKVYAKADYGECLKKSGVMTTNISQMKQLVEQFPDNFILYKSFFMPEENFFLMSDEIKNEEFRCQDKKLYKKSNGKTERDDYSHEAFAVFFPDKEKSKGCVIISSCTHCGIVNVIRTVRRNWKDVPIIAIIGGMHIMGSSTKKMNCDDEYIKKMTDEIKLLDAGMIYTCHCTGLKGYEALKYELGDQIQYLQTGEELTF